MSTISSIKYERDEATGTDIHVYREGFEPESVYVELTGFPVEVNIGIKNPATKILVRLPLNWAAKLGVVTSEYAAQFAQIALDQKARELEEDKPDMTRGDKCEDGTDPIFALLKDKVKIVGDIESPIPATEGPETMPPTGSAPLTSVDRFDALMDRLKHIKLGGPYTRDEMNEG
jgi:hypothetical protein